MKFTSKLINALGLPVRLIFSHETVNKLGLRSMRDEMGLSRKYIIDLFNSTGYDFILRKRFILGLNNLYIFEKKH
jgi:hypothetical protein